MKKNYAGWLMVSMLLVISHLSYSQVVNIPSSGYDTTRTCVGLFNDPGGNSNYPSYANGYLIIDPPGNATVNVQFSTFNTYSSSDYVRIYDGVGYTGTLLGIYSGNNLPNNGSAITSTSGAITLQFVSNCCSQSSGFQGNFTTNTTSVPNASFVPSTTTPAYNSSVQFINTTSGGATYLWDFGDGSTSTDINPTHSYTLSGPKQVKLIATNCSGSDTSNIVTITVQSAPQGSLSTDTVKLTAACGTSNSTSFTVSNSGSGNLSYGLSLAANSNMLTYFEDFENGLGDFSDLNSVNTVTFPTTGAPEGNQYMSFQSNNGFNNPLVASIPSTRPEHISYYTKSDLYASYHGQFRIGNGNFNLNEPLFMSQFRYGGLYLYYRDVAGNYTTSYYFAQTYGQWYHIELRNIDWTARTFDIYIDNALIVAGAGIYSPTIADIDFMSLASSYSSTVGLDAIQFDGLDPSSIFTYSPTSGNLSNGSNSVIFINANASGLNAGVYNFDFTITSNDTTLDGKILPLELTVTGTADLSTDKNCSSFGNIFTNVAYKDSVMLTNTGCDTLNFTGITATSSDLVPAISNLDLVPGDTTYMIFTLSPSSIGVIADTLYFQGPDTNYSYCVNATASGAPSISLDSTSYTINHIGCNDSAQFKVVIANTGLDTLRWSTSGFNGITLSDDFETGALNPNLWAPTGNFISPSTTCGIISGNYSISFRGSGRSLTTIPLDLSGGGTVSYDVRFRGTCETPDPGEGIYIMYSINNGVTWQQMGYHYLNTTNTINVSEPIPAAAQTASTLIRIVQSSYSGSTYDNWVIDNVSIQGVSNSSALIFLPDTGNLAVNSFDTVNVWIDLTGYTTGVYNLKGYVNSNDPSNPVLSFPITLNFTGLPNLEVPVTCHQLDTVIMGATLQDSVLIYNNGCGDIQFSSITNSNPWLSILNAPGTLAVGDSLYLSFNFSPTTGPAGFTDTIKLNSANIPTASICLGGYVTGAPSIGMDSSAINVTINGCNDSINIQRWVNNSGLVNLDYQVIGGSGLLSLQDVLDTFKAAYTTVTAFNTSQYNFADGIFGSFISDGGGDMYDGGNYITTNPINTANLFYSNDQVISNTTLGTSGQYFTYKGTGIFLFAADIDNVNDFRIYGNLGADGSGTADASTISSTLDGVNYTGYIKRVHSAGDPSINHLIITQQNPNIVRNFETNTNIENHRLSGLQANTRIYYLLFAGNFGTNFPDAVFQGMMDQFLSLLGTRSLPSWVSVVPDSGSVAVNDSVLLDIWIKSEGLTAGSHSGNISVASNDPANPIISIPITLNVIGEPEIQVLQNSCVTFTNVLQGVTASDSVFITNSGCDTLDITGISNALSEFSVSNSTPLYVAPGDTVPLVVEFLPITVGSFIDTITVQNNDTVMYICLNGTSAGAPIMNLPGDSLKVEVNKCNIIKTATYRVENQGQGALDYDMKIGVYRNSGREYYNTTGATTYHHFYNTPPLADTIEVMVILKGDFSQYGQRPVMYINNNYFGNIYDNNVPALQNDTLIYTIYGANVQYYMPYDSLNVRLVNNGSVTGLAGSYHQINLRVVKNANWVAITGAAGGTLAPSAGRNHNFLFNTAGLTVGKYKTVMSVESNEPGQGYINVPIIMDVISEEAIELSDTCLFFSSTQIGDTTSRVLSIYNTGCQPLNVSSIISSNNVFKVSPANGIVGIGDTLEVTVDFTPTSPSNFSASLTVNNSDSTYNICLNGLAIAKPVASFSVSPENLCLGEIAFTDNSQYSPTSWNWDFGDGQVSTQPNPTHFYQKPGTYKVKLLVQNTHGFDTISDSVTVSPLFVDFSYSKDTVDLAIDSTVAFNDSSLTAAVWMWDFGDGNTSIVQNPVHTYSQTGKMTVKLTVTDNRGCQREKEYFIYVVNTVGEDEFVAGNINMNLFPNPTNGHVTLNIEGKDIYWLAETELVLTDLAGKTVMKLSGLSGNSTKLELSNYESGVYLINIFHKNVLIESQRVILQK